MCGGGHRVLLRHHPLSLAHRPVPSMERMKVSTPAHGIRSAIAAFPGSCDGTVDHAGWVVTLLSPEEETFSGRTLEEALAWCPGLADRLSHLTAEPCHGSSVSDQRV